MNYKILFSIAILFLFACSPSEEEAKKQVDDFYSEVKAIPASEPCKNLEGYKKLQSLEDRRGTSYYSDITQKKIKSYDSKCKQYKQDIENERKRKEEMNKLGSWEYGYYVDDFGDKTKNGYIRLVSYGKFSNSATTDSALRVQMYLNNGSIDKPWFRLYEYDGKNPVKGVYDDDNSVACRVKDKEGSIFKLGLYQGEGWNFFRIYDGSSLRKNKENLEKFKDIISSEGTAKFSCYEKRYSSTKYNFVLYFKYYANALRKYNSNE